MSDERVGSAAVQGVTGALAHRAGTAMWTAGVAIVVGLATGVALVLQRREVTCADGTFFPEGETDFRCFSHPHALVGTSVIAAFVGLAAVVYLAWLVIVALDARSQPTD